jgi:hypothetical protein
VNRAAELARARAAAALSDEDALVWFGVGLATLERIEAGEIEPSAEVAHRIDLFLQTAGGGVTLSQPDSPDRRLCTHSGGPGGGALKQGSSAEIEGAA